MNLLRIFSRIIGALVLMGAPLAGAQLSLAIVFNSDASGISLGGSGTANASIAMGAVKAFGGSVPTGVTKTVNGSTSWTLSTPFDVDAIGLGIIVPTFTLTAKLQTADAVNTWKIGSITLSTTNATLTSTGSYNVNTPYTLNLTIPFSAAAGSISNTINFTAIGN
jgi:hypothetical protein